MPRSMTGFGSGSASSEHGAISVELRCLNHRYRDIKVRLPRELAFLEPVVITKVSERIERGAIEISLRYPERAPAHREAHVDEALAGQVVESMRALKAKHGLSGGVTTEALMAVEGVVQIDERPVSTEGLEQLVEQALTQALEKALKMREEEGLALGRDLVQRVDTLLELVDAVAEEARKMPAIYKERLQGRLKALLDDVSVEPGRLEAEVAILADRSDVTEELTRLRSHLEQLKSLIEKAEESVGRRIGFLLQEVGREVNTIGSKHQSLLASRLVLDIKSELERMREQVQNIE